MADVVRLNYRKGALFALGGPIAGIMLWIFLWWFGFIASITAFAMAWLTIWLFRKGAGNVDKKSLDIIIPYIVVGLVLAFFASFSLDSAYYAQQEVEGLKGVGIAHILTSSQFWSFNLNSFISLYDLAPYTLDIIISVGFGILGTYPTIKSLKTEVAADETAKKSTNKTTPKEVSAAIAEPQVAEQVTPKTNKKQKKAWLAVVLNIIPGAGYLYLNPRRVFGWILLISQILFVGAAATAWNDTVPEVTNATSDALGSVGFILLYASFMVDAYFETKRVNKV